MAGHGIHGLSPLRDAAYKQEKLAKPSQYTGETTNLYAHGLGGL